MADLTITKDNAVWLLGELFKINPTAQLQVTNLLLTQQLAKAEMQIQELSRHNGLEPAEVPDATG